MQSDDTVFLPRKLAPMLLEALSDTPVVCLLGSRQCGKSTLAQRCEPDRSYINLDDKNFLDLAKFDPEGFIDGLPERVTIDEIQRAPELSLAIKRSVDARRTPGRFLLTGSANLLQLPRLADSLAGRMECLFLQPLIESEKCESPGQFLEAWLSGNLSRQISASVPPAKSDLPGRLVAGGYPSSFTRSPKRARAWQRQFLQSIIERDIRDVADVKNGRDVARLLEYFSNQTATLINVTATANSLKHTRTTIERYLGVLEKLFLVRVLPAWHSNRNKRLVKAPKIHLCDSGLAAVLSQLREELWMSERTRFGHLLESFVVQQIITMGAWHDEQLSFYHYRDKDQVEVDLVIESRDDVWGIEVKAAATVKSADGNGLRRLAQSSNDRFKGGIVFYDGSSILPIDSSLNIYAVPLRTLWEL